MCHRPNHTSDPFPASRRHCIHTAVLESLRVQGIGRLTPDMTGEQMSMSYAMPHEYRLPVSYQITGKPLGTIIGPPNRGSISMPLEHNGGPTHDHRAHELGQVSMSQPKCVNQALQMSHAIMQTYAGQGWPLLQHVQFACLLDLALSLQGHQEWHNVAVVVVHEQIAKRGEALLHPEPAKLRAVIPPCPSSSMLAACSEE